MIVTQTHVFLGCQRDEFSSAFCLKMNMLMFIILSENLFFFFLKMQYLFNGNAFDVVIGTQNMVL